MFMNITQLENRIMSYYTLLFSQTICIEMPNNFQITTNYGEIYCRLVVQ